MNLVLLFPNDFTSEDTAVLKGRRFTHVKDILKSQVNDHIKVGLLNGKIGHAVVTLISPEEIKLQLSLTHEPPPPLSVTLLLALPRPKMLKRILQTVATMGVKELYLINSYRVEKSFWSTPILKEQLNEQLILGLEQAGDTRMPKVHLRKRFKPFVEDELPSILASSKAYVAHPYKAIPCPPQTDEPLTLAIGPEGGFIPYEIEKLQACGFEAIHLGERILRVETAVPALLSRLTSL